MHEFRMMRSSKREKVIFFLYFSKRLKKIEKFFATVQNFVKKKTKKRFLRARNH